jgi:hypothetical protein
VTHTVSRTIADETLSRIIQIESAGNPNAKAPTSSALGLGQFIAATWLDIVARHRPDLMTGRSRADVLALRTDPPLAVEMLARLTEDNAKALGAAYTDADLYLAHFAGVAVARRVLRADAGTAVATIFSSAAINANPSILRGKTCGEVRAWAAAKMAKAGGRDWVGRWHPAGKSGAGASKTPDRSGAPGQKPAPSALLNSIVSVVVTLVLLLLGWLAQD